MSKDYRDLLNLPAEALETPKLAADQCRHIFFGLVSGAARTCSTGDVGAGCDLKANTVYGQASGRWPLTLQAVGGLAAAGDVDGACRTLAPLLFFLTRQDDSEAVLDLAQAVVGSLGYQVLPASRVATDEELCGLLKSCIENAGELVQRLIRIIGDGGVNAAERAELRECLPTWIFALQRALALASEPGKIEDIGGGRASA